MLYEFQFLFRIVDQRTQLAFLRTAERVSEEFVYLSFYIA